MKNKLLTILTSILLASLCLFTLTACEEPHSHTYVQAVTQPTCTEQGYTTNTCECGDSYVDNYVDELGHSFTNYISDNNATYDNDGTKTAKCDNCDATDTITDKGSKLQNGILFSTLTVNDETVYGKVSNSITTFSFIKEIVEYGTATYKVFKEITCETEIQSKTIPLNVGDNTVYVLQTVGKDIKLYTVTVRRKPMYEVTFKVLGGYVESQSVEEDAFAVEPTTNPTRSGYTFNGWNYNFAEPITENITITAKWQTNKYSLTIVYGNGQEDRVITQDYNTYIPSIANPEKVGYTFNGWDKSIPTTMPAENLTITAKWLAIFNQLNGEISSLTTHGKTLTEIVIPDEIDGVKITSIGERAFENCSSLTSVTIGNNVTSIGDSAFSGCSSLTKVNYLGTIDSWAQIEFSGYSSNPLIYAKNLYINDELVTEAVLTSATKISDYAFRGCSSLTSIVIPDSVTSIGNSAFHSCESLTSITIPDSVTSIGSYAFEYCDSLTSVTIGNGVTSIGEDAFRGCSSLTSITIPDSVTSIGSYAFVGCISLTSIEIPNSVTSIGEDAFYYCCKLVEVINKSPYITVEKGSSSNGCLGCCALSVSNCDSSYVSKLSTDSNGYVIHSNGSDKILVNYEGSQTELTLPSGITEINKYAFYNNNKITSVVIPDSVTSIGYSAFFDCSLLTSITIGNGVTSIGEDAFLSCESLTSITIGNGVTSIGSYAFRGCSSLTSITIPDSVTSIGSYAFDNCESLTSVTIGNGVTSIGSYAFRGCSSLTSIEIPNSVTSIGYFAFAYCSSLTSVTIPDSVTSIGNYAFSSCTSLTSIEIPNGVTSIGSSAFAYCTSLTSVTIGNGVTSIGSSAFRGCSSLTSIEIPNSVTSIGEDAFAYCRSLTSITFSDTSTWHRTTSNSDWENKTGGTQTSVTNSSTNATYFKSTYCDYYWYKI